MSRDMGQTATSRCFAECEREQFQRRIAELEATIEVLRGTVASQKATIERLCGEHDTLEARELGFIQSLRELEAENAVLEQQLAEQKILAEPLTKELYKEMSERHEAISLQLAALREELDSHDEYTLCDCCQSLTLEPVDAGDHMQCVSCTELANAQAQLAALREAAKAVGKASIEDVSLSGYENYTQAMDALEALLEEDK